MNTQQTTTESQIHALHEQATIVREFFQKDNAAEMISSLNALTEAVLFSSDVQHVTPDLQTDIVNNLRVVTLLAKLDRSEKQIKS